MKVNNTGWAGKTRVKSGNYQCHEPKKHSEPIEIGDNDRNLKVIRSYGAYIVDVMPTKSYYLLRKIALSTGLTIGVLLGKMVYALLIFNFALLLNWWTILRISLREIRLLYLEGWLTHWIVKYKPLSDSRLRKADKVRSSLKRKTETTVFHQTIEEYHG